MKPFIDHSQYSDYMRCPEYWRIKYVEGFDRKREGQRSDTLALGGLTHGGLEVWGKHQRIEIPPTLLEEFDPTPETHNQALRLVCGYVERFPAPLGEERRFEEPVRWPLNDRVDGLAKIDSYFYLSRQTEVDSGLPGFPLVLPAGWWINEYKTKSAVVSRRNWNMQWEASMQADFQLLALGHRFAAEAAEEYGAPLTDETPCNASKGLVISVLEKPRDYTPTRNCAGCGERLELASFLPMPSGEHACPLCGVAQKLKPYTPKSERKPFYYRIVVTRTPERLVRAAGEIGQVAGIMELMREGAYVPPPNRTGCVHPQFGVCSYFAHCAYGRSLDGDPSLTRKDPTAYVRRGE